MLKLVNEKFDGLPTRYVLKEKKGLTKKLEELGTQRFH